MTRPRAGALDPQGPVAEAAADLWWVMFWLALAVFVLFAVLLGVGLFRGSRAVAASEVAERRAGPDEPAPGEPAGEPAPDERALVRRWVVGGGVLMPLLVLVVVFGATVYAMRVSADVASPDAFEVEVVGHQWWFEVRYPDSGVTTRDELHIPVGRAVAVKLTSADVIHSFWVPALGGKMDMLPDGTNILVLRADSPGEHHAQCPEFCGLHHADMKLRVIAEPAEKLDAWLAGRR